MAEQQEKKKKMGRPRVAGQRANVTMSWPIAARDAIDDIAEQQGRTRTDLILDTVMRLYPKVRQAMEHDLARDGSAKT